MIAEKLGTRAVLGFWCSFCVPGILWLTGNICGGLAQGRKPHGGSERQCIRPPLTFLREGGLMPLG